MSIIKFLQEVMVIIGVAVKDVLAISKKPHSNKDEELKLTAMGYSKQMDLFELIDMADPQCKCDHRG